MDQNVGTQVTLDQASTQCSLIVVLKEYRAPSTHMGTPFLYWDLYCMGHNSSASTVPQCCGSLWVSRIPPPLS